MFNWIFKVLQQMANELDITLEVALLGTLKNGEILRQILKQVSEKKKLSRSGAKVILKNMLQRKYPDNSTINYMITTELKEITQKTGTVATRL